MTYDQLVARLANLQATDTADADFVGILPAAIDDAELRCYRDLVPVALLRLQDASLVAGTRRVAVPDDFIACRSMTLRTGAGAFVRAPLVKRDQRFLLSYWPDANLRGTPKYWSELGYGVLEIAPPPADGVTLEMEYVSRPSPLSATNPETWLSKWCPDLLLSAAMVFLSGYNRNYGGGDDPRVPGHWEGEYQKHLLGAKAEEAQRRGLVDAPPGSALAAPPG